MDRALLVGFVLLCAVPGSAEIYRCRDGAGSVRFTSDPRACPGAEAVKPDPDRVVTVPTPAAPAPRTEEPAPIDASRLAHLLPPTPRGWEPTYEAVAVERDPTLRAQGLRASVARHYGRWYGAVTEVCTVELWSFASAAQARASLAALDLPRGWKRVSGTLLVMARGVRLERGVGTRHGLVPGCQRLAESVDASRAAPR